MLNKYSAARLIRIAILLTSIAFFVGSQSGCSTLSSFGFPFGGSSNVILKPAQEISTAPGQSFLIPKELAKEPLAIYVVEIGDTILIEPVRFDATIRLPGDQVVKPDGMISIGEFGRYSAINKSLDQIRFEVQNLIYQRLRQQFEIAYEIERRRREEDRSAVDTRLTDEEFAEDLPMIASTEDREARTALDRRIAESFDQNEVSVRLINWESKRVYVLGEVNSPGSFTYSGNQTVLDALVEAGGVTSKANRHQIIVARPSTCSSCRTVMKIFYDQIVQLGDASTNYQLQPGDRVFVPSLTFKDDLIKTFNPQAYEHCPRCSDCPRGCELPTGCE